jgi:hypothetical protein
MAYRKNPPAAPGGETPSNSPDILAFGRRLMAIGWACEAGSATGPDGTSAGFKLTEEGQQRLGQLLQCCREMGLPTFNKDEAFGFMLWLDDQVHR